MDEKMHELIAVGASYARSCETFLAYHIRQASQMGANTDEIMESIGIAQKVIVASTQRLDNLIERLTGKTAVGMV